MVAWRRHFFYTKESVHTTWKLRLAVALAVLVAAVLTRGFWVSQIGRSLVCADEPAPSDMILIENFDPNYLLFEQAAALEQAGIAPRALVPVESSSDPGVANPVSRGIAEVMARQARLRTWQILPVHHIEPISLNAALEIRDHLARDPVKSLLLVTPGFRSRRSSLVLRATLQALGTEVRCVPVFGLTTPEDWTETWHGIKEVLEEFFKLQYYRFGVLPFRRAGAAQR
jgi:hypothetical protein